MSSARGSVEACAKLWLALKFQSMFRGRIAREEVVLEIQKYGTLLAMPGTVQGHSGWYQMVHGGNNLAIEFVIDETGKWQKTQGPHPMGEWMREQRTKQRTKLPARSARANTYRQRFLCSVFAQQCRQKNNSNTVEDMLTEFKGLEQLLQVAAEWFKLVAFSASFQALPYTATATATATDSASYSGSASLDGNGNGSISNVQRKWFEAQLATLYTQYDPKQVPRVQQILRQYEGREEALVSQEKKKYGFRHLIV